jgi:addiction module toxin, RelE/StbE family
MPWKVEITPDVRADLNKLEATEARRILKSLFERLQGRDNTRETGESLKGNLREFWRYCVGDFRLLCRLEDSIVTVFVVYIGHRRKVHKTT